MIFNFFRKQTDQEKCAIQLYAAIVAQARQPEFYMSYTIPDDINGRFEMIVLHTYMLCHRLKDEDEASRDLGQAVFDRFFQDMDHSLRERGIGDLSVPKKIKKMAQAFYGRVDAYDEAREAGRDELVEALCRNFFPEDEDQRPEVQSLADYVYESTEKLSTMSVEEFKQGTVKFGDIQPHKNA